MILKSDIIAAATADLATAQSELEQAVRSLVAAEQGPGEWTIGVPSATGASEQTAEINGNSYFGSLASFLSQQGSFDGVEEHDYNPDRAIIKSHTQPPSLQVLLNVYDSSQSQWNQQGPVEMTWSALT
jgi:hypothetical protein